MACLILPGCLLGGPGESDLVPILMQIQSDSSAGPPERIKIEAYECKLMNHGQAHECDVEFVATRDGTVGLPRRLYLIVSEGNGGWRLISHEPRK